MSTIQELRLAKLRANEALRAKTDERSNWTRELLDVERRRITEEANKLFGAGIESARQAAIAAGTAYNQRLDEDARNGVGAAHPIGTRFFEWKREGYRFQNIERKLVKTGRSALYIAVTEDTVLPGNLGYSRPNVGEFVLQLTKKDGKQGLQIVPHRDRGRWRPEGVDPNVPLIPAVT